MLINFKYFFYGCPEVGEPDCIYALYHPVEDCFLICTTNWRTANKLKMLLSSRYNLYIVEITKAKNYQHNLIDNLVCENWSFVEKGLLNINELPRHDMPVFAKNLCASTQAKPADWVEEKKYAMLCAYWIEQFIPDPYKKFESNLSKFLGHAQLPVYHNEKKTRIMQLLYLGQDAEQTDAAINKIING